MICKYFFQFSRWPFHFVSGFCCYVAAQQLLICRDPSDTLVSQTQFSHVCNGNKDNSNLHPEGSDEDWGAGRVKSVLWAIKLHVLEKAMAPHSSTLAWKIPWTEEPDGLQSIRLWRVGHGWVTSLSLFTFMHWRRKWQPTPVFLPGESGTGEPVGLPSMGSHRVGHNWSDLAVAVIMY